MNEDLQKWMDEQQIREVRRLWAYGRDLGEWDLLRSVFHPDATVHVSWFNGPAAEFVTRSSAAAGRRRPGEQGKHWLGNMRTNIRGARAIQETDVQIMLREYLDGYLFDSVSYGRFFDRIEKRDGRWKILSMTCIYEKDRIDPVIPGTVPASFYEGVKLQGPDAGFAFMQLRLRKHGRKIVPVVMSGSKEEAQLRTAAERWLSQ